MVNPNYVPILLYTNDTNQAGLSFVVRETPTSL